MPIFIKGDTSMFTFARPLTSTSRRFLFLTLLSVCLLAAIPALTSAQVLYGSLVGNVTDPNGAAVSGAKVEVTNLATGSVSSVMTDDRGGYSLNDLQVGVYKVTISRASFKTTIREDVWTEASNAYGFAAALEVGGVEETVVVTAGQEATLQTDRGDVNVTQTAR